MIELFFSETPSGELLNFDTIMDMLYKNYTQIRVFGMRVGEGSVQIKHGFCEKSFDIYLPYDSYYINNIAELCNIIDELQYSS